MVEVPEDVGDAVGAGKRPACVEWGVRAEEGELEGDTAEKEVRSLASDLASAVDPAAAVVVAAAVRGHAAGQGECDWAEGLEVRRAVSNCARGIVA